MEIPEPDLSRAESQAPNASLMSSLAVYEPSSVQLDEPMLGAVDSDSDSLPKDAVTTDQQELTEHVPGDTATHHNNGTAASYANGSAASHTLPASPAPQFDPRALLNPKSAASKRPASSGGEEADRGRIDPTVAGQISLVERLHNVQERTASPAKRVKTEDPRKQNVNRANFGGGSTLDLQNPNGQSRPPQPQQGPAIDLTMSKDSQFAVWKYR
jgi:hypothetical protein